MTARSPTPSAWPQPGALEALAALRAEYAKALPERVRRLGRALRACRRAPADARTIERARSLAHTLRGTAGSYGHPAVSASVGRIEDAIVRAASAPGDAGASAWSEVWSALREAEALTAEVGS